MFDKKQYLDSIRQEIEIAKHLHGKIPADQADRRLAEGMRSNLELLRYMTYCASLPATCCVEGSWGQAAEMVKASGAPEMKLEDFPAAMDRQLAALEKLLEPLSEEDLESRRVPLPWGTESTLGEALVNTSLKFLAAYRMQLFLQLKVGGVQPLDTFNCWLGCDRPGKN